MLLQQNKIFAINKKGENVCHTFMQQKLIIITGNDEELIQTVSKNLLPNQKDYRYNYIRIDKFTMIVYFPYFKMENFGNIFRFPQQFEHQLVIFCTKGEQLILIEEFVRYQQLMHIIKVVTKNITNPNPQAKIKRNYFEGPQQIKNNNQPIFEEIQSWLKSRNNKSYPLKQLVVDDSLQIMNKYYQKQQELLAKINNRCNYNEEFLRGIHLPDSLAYFQFAFYVYFLLKNEQNYFQLISKYYCQNCKTFTQIWLNQYFLIQFTDKGISIIRTNKKCSCSTQNFAIMKGRKPEYSRKKLHQQYEQNEQLHKMIEDQVLYGYFELYNPISKLQKESETQISLSQNNVIGNKNILNNQRIVIQDKPTPAINVLFLSVEDSEKNELFLRLSQINTFKHNNIPKAQHEFFQSSIINSNNVFYYNSPALSMGNEEDNQVEMFRSFFQQVEIDFLFVCVVYQRTDIMKSRINQIVKKFVGVARDQIGIIVMNYHQSQVQMQEVLKQNLQKQFKCVLFDVEINTQNNLTFQIQKEMNSVKKNKIDISNTEFASESLEDRRMADGVEQKLRLMQISLENKNNFKISQNYGISQSNKYQNIPKQFQR